MALALASERATEKSAPEVWAIDCAGNGSRATGARADGTGRDMLAGAATAGRPDAGTTAGGTTTGGAAIGVVAFDRGAATNIGSGATGRGADRTDAATGAGTV